MHSKVEHYIFFLRYGYITNTKIKFLIVIETSNQQYHDTEIKIVSLFRCTNIQEKSFN